MICLGIRQRQTRSLREWSESSSSVQIRRISSAISCSSSRRRRTSTAHAFWSRSSGTIYLRSTESRFFLTSPSREFSTHHFCILSTFSASIGSAANSALTRHLTVQFIMDQLSHDSRFDLRAVSRSITQGHHSRTCRLSRKHEPFCGWPSVGHSALYPRKTFITMGASMNHSVAGHRSVTVFFARRRHLRLCDLRHWRGARSAGTARDADGRKRCSET